MLYRKNIYAWEQLGRIAAGAGLAAYGALGGFAPFVAMVVAVSGVSLALTGLFGWCPACAMFGRQTRQKD